MAPKLVTPKPPNSANKPPAQSGQSLGVRSPGPPSLPPDPGLVEFDLTIDELPDLPVDAFEPVEVDPDELDADFIQKLDSTPIPLSQRGRHTQPVAVHSAPPPLSHTATPEPSAPPAEAVAPWDEAPKTQPMFTVVTPMLAIFMGSMGATMMFVLLPWFALVSPRIDASRQAREAARAASAPKIVQVPVPVVAPAPPVTDATVADAASDDDADDASAEESTDEASTDKAATPAPKAAPRPKPRTRPRASPKPKPKATPKPKPKAAAAPAPAPKEPVAAAPEAAVSLNGTVSGTANKVPISMTFDFRADGKLKASITRDGKTVPATGNYTLTVGRASFYLKERTSSTVYTGMLGANGASGKVRFEDGKSGKIKVKR